MVQGVDVVDVGLVSTDLVYFAAGRYDAPGAMFTASHNPAQYNGVKLCLAGARPVGADTGLADVRRVAEAVLDRPPARAGVDAGPPHHRRPAGRVRRPRRVVHRPHRRRPAAGRGRHRQRDGRPGRAQGLRAPPPGRAGGHVRRARRDLPQPPRRPDPARQPARPAGPRGRRRVRPRPRLRRRRRPRLRGRRGRPRPLGLDHHGDARRRDAGQAPGRHHPPQPHLLPGRARGRPRARRHPHPDQGRPQLHQADHGRERRRVRRRALGPLLLPRQLPGRLRHHRHDARARAAEPGRRRAVDGAQALRALRRVGRDQHRRRRPARR